MDSAISFSNIIYLVLVVLIVMALRSAIKEHSTAQRTAQQQRLSVIVPDSHIIEELTLKPVCMC